MNLCLSARHDYAHEFKVSLLLSDLRTVNSNISYVETRRFIQFLFWKLYSIIKINLDFYVAALCFFPHTLLKIIVLLGKGPCLNRIGQHSKFEVETWFDVQMT